MNAIIFLFIFEISSSSFCSHYIKSAITMVRYSKCVCSCSSIYVVVSWKQQYIVGTFGISMRLFSKFLKFSFTEVEASSLKWGPEVDQELVTPARRGREKWLLKNQNAKKISSYSRKIRSKIKEQFHEWISFSRYCIFTLEKISLSITLNHYVIVRILKGKINSKYLLLETLH